MTNVDKPTPDDRDPRKPVKTGPPRWAQLAVGLSNLLLRVIGWLYFLITGEWPDWPLR
jgi:hypothetical protein